MDGQKNRYSEKEKIDSWILFCLQSLETLIKRLEQKYDVYRTKGGYLNKRQKQVKECIEKYQPLKISDIKNALPDLSVNTIKKDLQYMKTEQIIESLGKNKGTLYVIKEK